MSNLAAGIITLDDLKGISSDAPRETLVAQELVKPGREEVNVFPRNQVTILSVGQPFAYSPGIKSDHRKPVPHGLGAGHPEWLRPKRTHNEHAGLTVKPAQFRREHVSLKTYAAAQPQLDAKSFTLTPMAPFAEDHAFKVGPDLRQCLQQHIHALSADQLTGKENQIAVVE